MKLFIAPKSSTILGYLIKCCFFRGLLSGSFSPSNSPECLPNLGQKIMSTSLSCLSTDIQGYLDPPPWLRHLQRLWRWSAQQGNLASFTVQLWFLPVQPGPFWHFGASLTLPTVPVSMTLSHPASCSFFPYPGVSHPLILAPCFPLTLQLPCSCSRVSVTTDLMQSLCRLPFIPLSLQKHHLQLQGHCLACIGII